MDVRSVDCCMGDIEGGRPLFGSAGGSHPLARFTDQQETYGPHVVERFVRGLQGLDLVLDLGAGSGRDLELVRRFHPRAQLLAIEAGQEYAAALKGKADRVYVANIERDHLPVADCQADLIIANQILEHTKEIFWIFHEISRSLRVGGHFVFGVPNICSLHNRFLLLMGRQPTQHKLCSAHVRPFSKADTIAFLNACFPGGYQLVDFRGAQFYPFPKTLARLLANTFPTFAFTIFFMLQKTKEYHGEFATYPSRAQLETNFWNGDLLTGSQYWTPRASNSELVVPGLQSVNTAQGDGGVGV
jgi:SAM-dependent methyltransferase